MPKLTVLSYNIDGLDEHMDHGPRLQGVIMDAVIKHARVDHLAQNL